MGTKLDFWDLRLGIRNTVQTRLPEYMLWTDLEKDEGIYQSRSRLAPSNSPTLL